jgi:hypothetical protein
VLQRWTGLLLLVGVAEALAALVLVGLEQEHHLV